MRNASISGVKSCWTTIYKVETWNGKSIYRRCSYVAQSLPSDLTKCVQSISNFEKNRIFTYSEESIPWPKKTSKMDPAQQDCNKLS